jgi:predicted cupin superfamily sugar epimerase
MTSIQLYMAQENLQTAAHWIQKLNLQPHPEGGYYHELYRSKLEVTRVSSSLVNIYSAFSSIYYLLEGTDYSGFHRLSSDEIWYFHRGVPLLIHMIDENGNYSSQELSDELTGTLSYMVSAGVWFASEIPSANGFSLVSCAVAPGFEFSEFEMAEKDVLLKKYPEHSGILSRLCREA